MTDEDRDSESSSMVDVALAIMLAVLIASMITSAIPKRKTAPRTEEYLPAGAETVTSPKGQDNRYIVK